MGFYVICELIKRESVLSSNLPCAILNCTVNFSDYLKLPTATALYIARVSSSKNVRFCCSILEQVWGMVFSVALEAVNADFLLQPRCMQSLFSTSFTSILRISSNQGSCRHFFIFIIRSNTFSHNYFSLRLLLTRSCGLDSICHRQVLYLLFWYRFSSSRRQVV